MQPGTKLRRSPHRESSRESGHVLIFTAACMTVLIGFAGLAADVGVLLRARRLLQTAADAGALSGVAELHYGGVTAAALAATARNGITNGADGAVVTVNNPPASGPHAGDAGYVEVITSEPEPTFFMRIFARNSATVSARAVAGTRGSKGCIYTLAPPGTPISLRLDGNVDVQIPGCPVIDNGDLRQDGGAGVFDAAAIGVGGTLVNNQGCVICDPPPVVGMAPVNDPLAYLPEPTCPAPMTYSGETSLNPATITNEIKIKNPTTFAPGMYCLEKGLTVDAAISGTGVTFYVRGGNITIVGNAPVNLTAPTSGTYNGILFFGGLGAGSLEIGGTAKATFTGIIYFPHSDVWIHGTDDMVLNTSIITNTLRLGGNPVLKDYAMFNGATPLGAPRLVE